MRWGKLPAGGKFTPYHIMTSLTIEKAYIAQKKYAEFTDGRTKMRVYFDKMIETVKGSKATSTEVQRQLQEGK